MGHMGLKLRMMQLTVSIAYVCAMCCGSPGEWSLRRTVIALLRVEMESSLSVARLGIPKGYYVYMVEKLAAARFSFDFS